MMSVVQKEFTQKNYLMRWKPIPWASSKVFFSESDFKLALLQSKLISSELDLESRVDEQPGNFKVYYIQSSGREFYWDVAFECPNCFKIMLGPPTIESKSLFCKSCRSRVGEFTTV